jgi:hypothetical protein
MPRAPSPNFKVHARKSTYPDRSGESNRAECALVSGVPLNMKAAFFDLSLFTSIREGETAMKTSLSAAMVFGVLLLGLGGWEMAAEAQPITCAGFGCGSSCSYLNWTDCEPLGCGEWPDGCLECNEYSYFVSPSYCPQVNTYMSNPGTAFYSCAETSSSTVCGSQGNSCNSSSGSCETVFGININLETCSGSFYVCAVTLGYTGCEPPDTACGIKPE